MYCQLLKLCGSARFAWCLSGTAYFWLWCLLRVHVKFQVLHLSNDQLYIFWHAWGGPPRPPRNFFCWGRVKVNNTIDVCRFHVCPSKTKSALAVEHHPQIFLGTNLVNLVSCTWNMQKQLCIYLHVFIYWFGGGGHVVIFVCTLTVF